MLLTRLRRSDIDASAGSVEAIEQIVTQIRAGGAMSASCCGRIQVLHARR
ncbi:hypothetical protein [Bradyrhizobium sp. 169]|nr:hypothetical protein [Bradyrhizobium sp. 169]